MNRDDIRREIDAAVLRYTSVIDDTARGTARDPVTVRSDAWKALRETIDRHIDARADVVSDEAAKVKLWAEREERAAAVAKGLLGSLGSVVDELLCSDASGREHLRAALGTLMLEVAEASAWRRERQARIDDDGDIPF